MRVAITVFAGDPYSITAVREVLGLGPQVPRQSIELDALYFSCALLGAKHWHRLALELLNVIEGYGIASIVRLSLDTASASTGNGGRPISVGRARALLLAALR